MRREAKAIVIMAMVGILVSSVVMPAMAANVNDTEKVVKIKVATVNPMGGKMEEKSITVGNAKKLVADIQSARDAFKVIIDPNSNESQKTWAMELIEKLIEELKELGLLPATFIFHIPQFLSPKFAFMVPVFSVGSGFSYIPLYPGEAFIGFMLRPIFLQYFLFGYTASINLKLIPPRLEYWDMVGTQTAMILGFVGIYIDFGKIGYGIPNMQFLLGESLFVAGIDWL